MYWIHHTATPPLNKQDVLVWNYRRPAEYTVAKYYDMGAEMDDGQTAYLSGFYTKNKGGRRALIRSGVSYFLPLEVPKPAEETKAKLYRRGYRAALLRTMAILEDMSRTAIAGEAWAIKDLHTRLQAEAKEVMSKGYITMDLPEQKEESGEEVRGMG